ncbi:peroxin-19 [Angomonas deanei]|uniref:Pex19 protein family, putative n=1 Tax=Angomonas deanei TaxID=59799 RepID=S9VS57_9TRYP|nr:peroxin-19 [Angomonas deanei]EPY43355.1 peroxin-19 [Angomonas deanei]CAD2216704.1 Pex19 protein family, putative [Angomonas deanei]|eukprot:EPY26055.1 peroxin-19 [Angomonas deanei]
MSDDDLDALLDEAMDIVEEKDRHQKEESERKKQKLEEDLQKASEELEGGDGMELLQSLQRLMGAAAAGDETDPALFDNCKNDIEKLMSMLDGADLTEDDKKNVDRMRELLNVMETDDSEKVSELLGELQKEGGEGGEAVTADMMKEYAENAQRISEALGGLAGQGAVPGAAAAAATPADAKTVEENMAEMLLSTILDPNFIEPIKLMKDAYPPYLEQNKGLAEEELERYKKQHAKVIEICEFLVVPIEKEDEERVARLLEHMHEFSQLGEPPEDLATYAPKPANSESE